MTIEVDFIFIGALGNGKWHWLFIFCELSLNLCVCVFFRLLLWLSFWDGCLCPSTSKPGYRKHTPPVGHKHTRHIYCILTVQIHNYCGLISQFTVWTLREKCRGWSQQQQYLNSYDLWLCLGGHHAWVPEEEVWRAPYPHLSLCAVPVPVCVHKDLSKSLRHHTSALSHISMSTLYLYWMLLIEMVCFFLSSPLRQTCSLAPFLSTRLWGWISTSLLSHCYWLPRCTPSQVCPIRMHSLPFPLKQQIDFYLTKARRWRVLSPLWKGSWLRVKVICSHTQRSGHTHALSPSGHFILCYCG